MDRQEVIEHVCQTVALAYHSIADYRSPSDGFCARCPGAGVNFFQHEGETLRYVRDAVVCKLKSDGYTIGTSFNDETGDEITETQHPAP